jgi:exopolyphosphatase / guanosine-5'-triphosphate,3'-diphosphate pyrophosphatase
VRVAVVDMGTNSTRLLVADVADGRVDGIERRSTVTRLGRGVDTTRQLATEAIDDVANAVGEYISIYEPLSPDGLAVLATSAVRDAGNADAFIAELRERFALDARILTGEEEARLTYLGAVAGRPAADGTLVIDIGGGSTEIVVGSGHEVTFHTSLQVGTVRHTERHIRNDPPTAPELEALAEDVRKLIFAELAAADFFDIRAGIAVAGTPTSLAAIEQELDPYDPEQVHGYVLTLDSVQRMYSMLSGKSLEERLEVTGLHPGRAPTIVAGVVILIQAMRAFGLQRIEVSEHDILDGAALEAADYPGDDVR